MPDHTTFSRRSPGLALATSLAQAQANGPVHVVSDATGLMVYGAGEWLVETHGERGLRTWRKLHLAVGPSTGEILASKLTGTDEGDVSQVGPLLGQIPGPLASVTADGAYGGVPAYRAVAERQPDPPVAVVPPRSTAVPSLDAGTTPSQRDQHIQMIQAKGALVHNSDYRRSAPSRGVFSGGAATRASRGGSFCSAPSRRLWFPFSGPAGSGLGQYAALVLD